MIKICFFERRSRKTSLFLYFGGNSFFPRFLLRILGIFTISSTSSKNNNIIRLLPPRSKKSKMILEEPFLKMSDNMCSSSIFLDNLGSPRLPEEEVGGKGFGDNIFFSPPSKEDRMHKICLLLLKRKHSLLVFFPMFFPPIPSPHKIKRSVNLEK